MEKDRDDSTSEFDDDPITCEIPRETMAYLVHTIGYNSNRGESCAT